MTPYALVYQCGMANVFALDTHQRMRSPAGRFVRLLSQGDYHSCEMFARGIASTGAGVSVRTYHCDEAGDIILRPWTPGPGDLFRESKRPVRSQSTVKTV